MMNIEGCKKRKRSPKVYGFQSFGEAGYPIGPVGPFRDNIRLFVQQCAEPETYTLQQGTMPIWSTLLFHESHNLLLPLYIIEENVTTSLNPFCDHCRCTGWSNHFVSKRKYHLIVPMDDDWNKPLEDGVLDHSNHLLHGLIHCNGFAHLLCINGLEGGSKHLCGRELMDLWDRICITLRTRKITVEDVSKKRSMALRLLHGVAFGNPWFGKWGYKFCHGSFGVKELIYERALEILSSLELEKIIEDFSDMDQYEELKKIVRYYRYLSELPLVTIKDIFRFMLSIKACFPAQRNALFPAAKPADVMENGKSVTRESLKIKPPMKEKCPKYRKFANVVSHMNSRWSARRLESAAYVIVNTLKEKKEEDIENGGMARQDVREAARLHIGDTGLLDYVLTALNNVIVGNQVVCRSVNPTTHILEYTVHDLDGGDKVSEPEKETFPLPPPPAAPVPGIDVYRDVLYLCEHVLLGYPQSELVQLATQTVLDTKHFVKEFSDEKEQLMTLFCQIFPSLSDKEIKFKRELPPGEMVVMPLNATVGELKQEAESALRDTYCITERFVVTEIIGLEKSDDTDVLFGTIQSGTEVEVRGRGIDLNTPLRYQGGSETWMVRCECGATDDDGERMVACDVREVWQLMDLWRDRIHMEILFECRNRGTTNVCLCLPHSFVIAADSRSCITTINKQGKEVTLISDEKCDKVRLMGRILATMSGRKNVCEDVWVHMEKFLLKLPNANVHEVAKEAFRYVKSHNLADCAMFICSVEKGVPVLYQLDHDNNEKEHYYRERLKLQTGHYFVIGSGSKYAKDILNTWDQSMGDHAEEYASISVLDAAMKEIYTGGFARVFIWNADEGKFQSVANRGIMDLYRMHFDSRLEDQEKGLFLMYGWKIEEEDIMSIPNVVHHGHQLAISTSGLVIRMVSFVDEHRREEYYKTARSLEVYPQSMYDDDQMLMRQYRHLKHMKYVACGDDFLFVAKPCKAFLYALETTGDCRFPFFSYCMV